MANKESLYLCHMTAEEKKAYNAKYYQEHKDYWREYYGIKGTRPTLHTLYDTEGHIDVSKVDAKKVMSDIGKMLGKHAGSFGSENAKRQLIGEMVNQYSDIVASNQRVVSGYAKGTTYDDVANAADMMSDTVYNELTRQLGSLPVSKKELSTMYMTRLKSALNANGITISERGGRRREKNVTGESASVKRSDKTINETLRDQRKQQEQNRLSTPDLNARLASRNDALSKQKTAARIATPDLNMRLSQIQKQPERIENGKSIFKKFASLWKLGWK